MPSNWVVPPDDKAFVLYYSIFHDCPEAEFAARTLITVVCFQDMVTQNLPFAHPLVNNETVATLVARLRKDQRLPEGKVRVYQVIGHSRLEEYGEEDPIVGGRGANLYFKVDVIPPELLDIDPNTIKLVQVNRFQIRTNAMPQPWETPFFFPVYRAEPFSTFWERLQPLLRFPEESESKIVARYAGNNQESEFTSEDIPFDKLGSNMVIQVYQLWELKITAMHGPSREDLRRPREMKFSLGGSY
jgi:hypothetical protein